MIFMALAKGRSRLRLGRATRCLHLQTVARHESHAALDWCVKGSRAKPLSFEAIWLAQQFGASVQLAPWLAGCRGHD